MVEERVLKVLLLFGHLFFHQFFGRPEVVGRLSVHHPDIGDSCRGFPVFSVRRRREPRHASGLNSAMRASVSMRPTIIVTPRTARCPSVRSAKPIDVAVTSGSAGPVLEIA